MAIYENPGFPVSKPGVSQSQDMPDDLSTAEPFTPDTRNSEFMADFLASRLGAMKACSAGTLLLMFRTNQDFCCSPHPYVSIPCASYLYHHSCLFQPVRISFSQFTEVAVIITVLIPRNYMAVTLLITVL